MSMQNKRKSVIVHKEIQYGVFGYFIFLLFILFITQSVGILLFIRETSQVVQNANSGSTSFLPQQFTWIYLICSLFPFLTLLILGPFLLSRFTHRVVGPLHKIDAVLDRHLKGERVDEITLRTDDYFQDLAKKINLLINKNSVK